MRPPARLEAEQNNGALLDKLFFPRPLSYFLSGDFIGIFMKVGLLLSAATAMSTPPVSDAFAPTVGNRLARRASVHSQSSDPKMLFSGGRGAAFYSTLSSVRSSSVAAFGYSGLRRPTSLTRLQASDDDVGSERGKLAENGITGGELMDVFGVTGLTGDAIKEALDCYREQGRFYHNVEHIETLISDLQKDRALFSEDEYQRLLKAILFHDAVYDIEAPSGQNEARSADLFDALADPSDSDRAAVRHLIEMTADRERPPASDKLAHWLWTHDNAVVFDSDLAGLLSYERKIMKEFQRFDYSLYRTGRLTFLESCLERPEYFANDKALADFKCLIECVRSDRPKIGVYCGSFNPFHIGHLSILEQAEKEYAKVVVAVGLNPEKSEHTNLEQVKRAVNFRQVVDYSTLTTDLLKKMATDGQCDITLIKGLRDGNDLHYEQSQIRVMRDLDPDVNVVLFLSAPEHGHISSSMIRALISMGRSEDAARYLP